MPDSRFPQEKSKTPVKRRLEERRNAQHDRFVQDAERLTDLEHGEEKFLEALRRVATAKPNPNDG
jgi:hypothetical protein